MFGKYKTDWLGLMLVLLGSLWWFSSSAEAQSVTITSVACSAGSGGTYNLYVYYSDSSYESWYYDPNGQGSGSGGAYWAWYLSSGGSGYGAPDASVLTYVDTNSSDYYYAQQIAFILSHPGWTTLPSDNGAAAFNAITTQTALGVNPPGICRTHWENVVIVGQWADYPWSEYGCVNGVETLIASGTCTTGGGPAVCSSAGNVVTGPNGWTGTGGPVNATDIGTCTCSSSGSCTGAAQWTAVTAADGSIEWQQTSNTCSSGCQGACPGAAPTADGVTATTDCTMTSPGPCPVKAATCSGTCNYTAVAVDASDLTKGYTWAFSDSDCNSYVSNCNCPVNPGGACPTGTGQTTSVNCGANDGGQCTGGGGGGTSSGSCDNSCVWKWVPNSGTPPTSCGCSWSVSVQRGSIGANGQPIMSYAWVSGGPVGSDCTSCTCTTSPVMQAEFAYQTGNEYITIACDGTASNDGSGRWEKQSGDCGKTCSCSEPPDNGTTAGEEKTTSCSTKPVACECSFSWTQVKTQLVDLLNSKFALALPAIGGNSCISFSLPMPGGGTSAINFCSSYPDAATWWAAIMETMRLFVRYLALAVVWWCFISYMIETLLSGW